MSVESLATPGAILDYYCATEAAIDRRNKKSGTNSPDVVLMTMRTKCRLLLALTAAFALSSAHANVQIQGLDGEILGNVLAHLALDDESCETPASRVRRLIRQSEQEIRGATEALGYYDPVIESEFVDDATCWQVIYTIDLGEPVRIRNLEIGLLGEADQDPAFAFAIAATPLKPGAVFRHDQYENLKRSLLGVASRRGYADTELAAHEVSVYPEELAVDVRLILDSGERYAFGAVRFEQDVINPDLAERYVTFRQGQPYDNTQLANLYSVLAGSGYFDQIQVEPLLDERADGEIPILITLSPGNRKIYSVGAGFSTNTGPRFRAGYTNRRFNKKGHQWGADLLLSDVVSELTANYRLPMGNPESEWLSFNTGYKHEETDTSTSDAYEFGVRRIRERANDWQESRYIDVLIDDFRIAQQRESSTFVIPGVSWVRTQAENRLRPDRGSRLYFEIRGSADALGSDTTFIQALVNAKWVRRVSERGRLLLRGELGGSLVDEFSELPPSVRFFTGGDSSVRGYSYESLGPTDATGAVIGGRNLVVASIEYEYELTPSWALATFVDSGNAFDDFDVDTRTGVGVGVRWLTPIGPLRVDIAKPLNTVDRSIRFHVSFGPDL